MSDSGAEQNSTAGERAGHGQVVITLTIPTNTSATTASTTTATGNIIHNIVNQVIFSKY